MKILVIHNTYLQKGGEDTVVEAETALLEANGDEVSVLLFDNREIAGLWGQFLYLFRSIYNRKAYRQVQERIAEFQPDVVHVHNTFYVASTSIYQAAHDAGVPVVQTLHNFRLICPSVYLFHKGAIYTDSIHKLYPIKAILKRVWDDSFAKTFMIASITAVNKIRGAYQNQVSRYIVFTDFSKEIFVNSSLRLPEEKFAIKPNFIPDPGLSEETREEFYLFVGRLSPEKGISVLLDAASRVDVPIYILGDGPMKAEVEAATRKFPNIRYVGLQPREVVLQYFRKAKAFIFPSLWYEGMPMVIVECMASGTPIIVSDLGNPGGMVEHEQNGLKFEAGNAAELVKQIQKLENEPELAVSLSRASRRTYEEKYSPEQNYACLIDIYRSCLHRNETVSPEKMPEASEQESTPACN